jgi:hypothetical protein
MQAHWKGAKQASRQAGREAGRQAGRQAGTPATDCMCVRERRVSAAKRW